jgi:DNA repair exonuclease SbcCD ATPase subunit
VTAASGSQIERLQRDNFARAAELERAHSLILSQKQKLRQTRAQAEELAVRLRGTATVEEENQTLKEEIEELQKKLKQMQLSGEAIQAENRRMVRTLEESSALTKRNNESFKSELEAMRAQNEKLSIALTFEKSRHSEFRAQQEQEIARYRLEVQRLQQWKANQAKTMARTVDKVLPRFATKVMNAIDRTESAIARKMDTLETQIGTLTVAAGRLSILKAPDDANDLAECDDFIAQFVGGIKSIEKLSQGYANSRPRKVKHKDEGETPGSGQSGLKMLSVNCDAE